LRRSFDFYREQQPHTGGQGYNPIFSNYLNHGSTSPPKCLDPRWAVDPHSQRKPNAG
jgi:hypothetical protein